LSRCGVLALEARTYVQVWLYAAFGFGVPGFIIWSVLGPRSHWPIGPPTYAMTIALGGGLRRSRRLNRRTQRGL
jgi:hypothetical protein